MLGKSISKMPCDRRIIKFGIAPTDKNGNLWIDGGCTIIAQITCHHIEGCGIIISSIGHTHSQ